MSLSAYLSMVMAASVIVAIVLDHYFREPLERSFRKFLDRYF